MNKHSHFDKGFLLSAALIVVAAFLGKSATADEMNQKQFLDLVGGFYSDVSPVFKDHFFTKELGIKLFEENGDMFLENRLSTGTKNSAARYKITVFECYNHLPESTSCGFSMRLENMGSFVHFLGVQPVVTVNRRSKKLRLEIRPDFERLGQRFETTVVEKR